MSEHVDNAGWATFATALAILTARHEVAQFATAMLTLATGIIVAHFLKRYLNERWPGKKREDEK